MTNNTPQRSPRLPAEWESDGAVLMAWPHAGTDWNYMLPQAQACFIEIIEAITAYQPVVLVAPETTEPKAALKHIPADRLFLVQSDTNDTWARDFGPITIELSDGHHSVADFCFNGWGLKFPSCHDNLVTEVLCRKKLITAPRINCRDFVLEGGGIESDGQGTIMTTALCQMSPNRNATLSVAEVKQALASYFGAKHIIWLEHGYLAGDDTDSHIDTLARFAPGNTIVYVGCDDPADEHYTELQAMKHELMSARTPDGLPYNLLELPLPDPIFDENGQRLPATYANFLITPHAVIMPVYGQPKKDLLARQIIQIAFDVPVVTVDCNALIRQHGSLHCVTMQMPSQILSI